MSVFLLGDPSKDVFLGALVKISEDLTVRKKFWNVTLENKNNWGVKID